jgi:hypothetical protein
MNCSKCSGVYMDTDYIIEKSKIRHKEQYDYSLVNYTTNLTLWYTFDTTSISGTTVIDSMGNYNGTLVNSATVDTVNKQVGSASISLDGVSKYVQLPTLPASLTSNNALSFSFWFKANNKKILID